MIKQFKIILRLFTFAFLFVATVSCVSTKSFLIELPQRSKNELPESIQSLLIVSRMADESYSNIDSDSLQRIFFRQKFDYDTIINDIQAVDTTLKALGELLFESGRYDFVIPENRFLPFQRSAFLTIEMEWPEVQTLCELYNTDAIVSLEHFKTRVSTDYSRDAFYDPYSEGFRNASVAKMKVNYEALFRIYDPEQKKVLVREFMRDTLFWEDVDLSTEKLFGRFTPVKQALAEAGIAVALDFSDQISVNWRQESRSIFVKGDENIKNGAGFADSNQWEPAMALWLETAEKSSNKNNKSKAELNLAVACEIRGDLQKAIEWALKSYNTMYRNITYNYLETLKRRSELLKRQQ